MAKKKRSFFERLTGTASIDEYEDEDEDELLGEPKATERSSDSASSSEKNQDWLEEDSGEGQLAVDVFQTSDEIVIKAHVAGVRPDELDISITRDMVTIKGKREEHTEAEGDNFFYKELYWGSFSRTILLPQEVEVESAEATEKHGLLTLRLPKIDKEKQTKLKVKG